MCMNTFIIILLTLLLCVIVHGDVYMNQPRGSNNKLNEVSDGHALYFIKKIFKIRAYERIIYFKPCGETSTRVRCVN